jgi:hypothetical protein
MYRWKSCTPYIIHNDSKLTCDDIREPSVPFSNLEDAPGLLKHYFCRDARDSFNLFSVPFGLLTSKVKISSDASKPGTGTGTTGSYWWRFTGSFIIVQLEMSHSRSFSLTPYKTYQDQDQDQDLFSFPHNSFRSDQLHPFSHKIYFRLSRKEINSTSSASRR